VEKSVLVVDDDTDICNMLTTILESELGVSTVQAFSGEEALDKVLESKPSLVLLDMRMPGGLGGLETIKRLKSDRATQSIPIIGMSGSVPEVMGLLAGCDDFIPKPFDVGYFTHRVQQHLVAQRAS
jgi:CheY-like chemotaxis protein